MGSIMREAGRGNSTTNPAPRQSSMQAQGNATAQKTAQGELYRRCGLNLPRCKRRSGAGGFHVNGAEANASDLLLSATLNSMFHLTYVLAGLVLTCRGVLRFMCCPALHRWE